jgi:hypothetical protein
VIEYEAREGVEVRMNEERCPVCQGKKRYKPEQLCHMHWVMWAYLGTPHGLSGCYVRCKEEEVRDEAG